MRSNVFLCFLLLGSISFAQTQPMKRATAPVKTNPQNRQTGQDMPAMTETLKKLPWEQLSASDKVKIRRIATKKPLFRSMPKQTAYSDPEIYFYLLQHPDAVVNLWQYLGATQLSLKELKKDTYLIKESSGTVATAEVLYRSRELCLIYAQGEYRGPFVSKNYSGEVLLILRSKASRDITGEPIVTCELDTLIAIDSAGADMLAKLFYTLLGKIADDNFAQTIAFVSHFSKTAAGNSDGLKQTLLSASANPNHSYPADKKTMLDLCDVIDRAAMRSQQRNNLQVNGKGGEIFVPAHSETRLLETSDYLSQKKKENDRVFGNDPFFAGKFEDKFAGRFEGEQPFLYTDNRQDGIFFESIEPEADASSGATAVPVHPVAADKPQIEKPAELDFDGLLLE